VTYAGGYLDYIIGKYQPERYIFIIRRKRVSGKWFLLDVEGKSPYPAIWTPHFTKAFMFPTEQEVEEFKCEFVSPRPCEIIRISR
jgi:hypothetical protein